MLSGSRFAGCGVERWVDFDITLDLNWQPPLVFFQAYYQPKLSPFVQDSSGGSTWLPQFLADLPPCKTNSLTDIAGFPRATIHDMSIMHPADTTHPITWDLHQNLKITQTFVFGQLSTITQTAQTLD